MDAPPNSSSARFVAGDADVELSLDRLRAILEHFDFDPPEDDEAEQLLTLWRQVAEASHPYDTVFDVGTARVRTWRMHEDDPSAAHQMRCNCRGQLTRGCEHIMAILLALCWRNPETRWLFEVPPWETVLRPLLRLERGPAAPESTNPKEAGWIRYIIEDPVDNDDWVGLAASPKLIRREFVRLSRVDGRELRPRRVNAQIEDLRQLVHRPLALDLRFHEMNARAEAIYAAAQRERLRWDPRRVLERQLHEMIVLLKDASDVRWGRRPITIDATPLTPEIRALEGGPDHVELVWEPTLEALLPIHHGFALTREGVLRPLDDNLSDDAQQLLLRPLPQVPRSDLGRFVEGFAAHAKVPVRFESGQLPQLHEAEQVERRLILREDDDHLVVEARFAYHVGDVAIEVASTDPASVLTERIDDDTLLVVQRDLVLETEAANQLKHHLRAPVPASLRGEEALDFLSSSLPELSEQWTLYGEQQLSDYKLRGASTARISVPAEVDWFDLEIAFEIGRGRPVAPAKQVLRSWLDGKRYHRLKDGSWVKLPRRWLERHGQALAELEEIRDAGDGRLGMFALPLASRLLEEAEANADNEDSGARKALRRWKGLLTQIQSFGGIETRAIPDSVVADLRSYQVRAFHWLGFLRDTGLCGCLADDMGLGKTLEALTLLADSHLGDADSPPSLVVAPTSVVHNWVSEAKRFVPDLRVALHHGPERARHVLPPAHVIVTSYALLRIDAELLDKTRWRHLVLDEAQQIKNPDSQVARTARKLNARHRLALTGTPLENNLYELWSVFQFLMPGFFGSKAAFTRRYAAPIHKRQDDGALAELRGRIKPFVLRRLKKEVATELPPRQEVVLYCELGDAQRALYESVKETYRSSVLSKVASQGVGRSTIHILEALMRLRQACCDPRLLPFEEARRVNHSAKMELLFETLEETIAAGHRSLVYSQWPSLLKLVQERLKRLQIEHLYLDGSTTRRAELVERWNDPEGPPLFLLSLKAGGSGLNLTGADHVIHLDPWWNPQVEAQATDRAHRLGQTRPVVAYKLVARGTVEEKILELQDRKRQLFEATVDAERMLVETLTRDDLEAVFAPQREQLAHTAHIAANDDASAAATPPLKVVASLEPVVERAPAPAAPAREAKLPRLVRRHIEEKGKLTIGDVRRLLECDTDTARSWLRERLAEGELVQHGRARGTWYGLT